MNNKILNSQYNKKKREKKNKIQITNKMKNRKND